MKSVPRKKWLVVGLSVTLCFNLGCEGDSSDDGFVRVEVPATVDWQGTGIVVMPDDTMVIKARGQWSFCTNQDGSVTFYGPEGSATLDPSAVIPVLPVGLLIGRVDGGAPFPIGLNNTVLSTREGELQLGMNEVPGSRRFGHGDNQGSVTAKVKIRPAASE
jgi:hypothetical protein